MLEATIESANNLASRIASVRLITRRSGCRLNAVAWKQIHNEIKVLALLCADSVFRPLERLSNVAGLSRR